MQECKDKGYDPPVEDYINARTKIKHKCKKGHVYGQTPNVHLNGRGCPKCYGKKTSEEYIQECKDKGIDLPIEDYKGAMTKIKHKCSKEHIYEQTPNTHLNGQGCPYCAGNLKKTSEQYLQECKEKGYDPPIEDYVNAHTKIKHKCSKGHVYNQMPNTHLNGQGCPVCKGTFKKTSEEYLKECKEKGYDLPIEPYKGNRIAIKHKCKNGHIYEQRPSDHLRGIGCRYCAGNLKKTSEQYLQECKDKGYDLPTEPYVNTRTKIKHKCSKGHIYEQSPDMHINKLQGCPICSESHGEKFIRNYLDKNNIKYIPQKKFDDLKDIDYLSYDFYLPDYNILIEYQGIQHYEPSEYFGGEEHFKLQQLHDNLKRDYAKDNGYKLLELKYILNTQELVDKYLSRRIK